MDVRGKHCLVVGGGAVSERKVGTLLEADAIVTVISPQLTENLKKLNMRKKIKWLKRTFKKSDTKGYRLVFGATDNKETNLSVYEDAQIHKTFANIADSSERCDFLVPASFHKGSISVAVSTNGKNPSLSAILKKKLERQISDEHVKLLDILYKHRSKLKAAFKDEKQRTDFVRFLEQNKKFAQWLKKNKTKKAEKYFLEKLIAKS